MPNPMPADPATAVPRTPTDARAAPRTPSSITLRLFLDKKQQKDFPPSTDTYLDIADVPIDDYEMNLRLEAMRRALAAHQAINSLLSRAGLIDMPNSLIASIERAESISAISWAQGRVLRQINTEANSAKHGVALPF